MQNITKQKDIECPLRDPVESLSTECCQLVIPLEVKIVKLNIRVLESKLVWKQNYLNSPF